jgi:hypothetical protein
MTARIREAVAIDNQGNETGIGHNLLILQDVPSAAQTVIGLTTSLCKSLPRCAKTHLLANQAAISKKRRDNKSDESAEIKALQARLTNMQAQFKSKKTTPEDYGPVRDCAKCGRSNVTHTLKACTGPPSRKKAKKALAVTIVDDETEYAMCVDDVSIQHSTENTMSVDPPVPSPISIITDPDKLDLLIAKGMIKKVNKFRGTKVSTDSTLTEQESKEQALAIEVESINKHFSDYSRSSLVLDSGATAHLISSKLEKYFHPEISGEYSTINKKIECAGGMTYPATKKGRLILKTETSQISISDVILVPGLKKNLISTNVLLKKGFSVVLEDTTAEITNKKDISFKLSAYEQDDGLFYLEGTLVEYRKDDQVLFVKTKDQDALDLYHLRLGHLSYGYIEKAVEKNLVTELNIPINFKKDIINPYCEDCERGKAHDKHGSGLTRDRKYENGEKIHTDLCGPFHVQSRRGNKYFQVVVDDTSNYCHVFFLRNKSEFFDNFIAFEKMIIVIIDM